MPQVAHKLVGSTQWASLATLERRQAVARGVASAQQPPQQAAAALDRLRAEVENGGRLGRQVWPEVHADRRTANAAQDLAKPRQLTFEAGELGARPQLR